MSTEMLPSPSESGLLDHIDVETEKRLEEIQQHQKEAEESTEKSAEKSTANPTGDQKTVNKDDEVALIYQAVSRSRLRWNNIDWVVTGFLAAMHLGCLGAWYFFDWRALVACIVLHWLTCSIGICLGYHRYLSHRSMKLKAPSRFFVLLCAAISGEGSPLQWAATHRLHHQRSDLEGDPHSPFDGAFWSHIFWLFPIQRKEDRERLYRRYAPELLNQPMVMFFQKTYALWLYATGFILMGLGYALNGWVGAVSFLVWGMCVRMTFAYHSTWLINSAHTSLGISKLRNPR